MNIPILSRFDPRTITTSDRNVVRDLWDALAPLPAGKQLFSKAIGMAAPYTGTIGAKVELLRPGYAEVRMDDRKEVRNHLKSVHAVALLNLAELTGNLALGYTLPDDARFIPSRIAIDYLKKARGTLRGICECPTSLTSERKEYELHVAIRNATGEEVAHAVLTTLVGPKNKES